MPLLSKIGYGSLLQYSVRGTTKFSKRSKAACHAIKFRAHPANIAKSVGIVADLVNEGGDMAGLFGSDVLLVPAPRHAPMPKVPGQSLWVPNIICEALVTSSLAYGAQPCLNRHTAVTKSATAGRHAKRDAQIHYDSLDVVGMQFDAPNRITVVDDFITTGATLLACASRISEAFPNSEVRCFGLVSPVSDGEVTDIVAPHFGEIELLPGNATSRN